MSCHTRQGGAVNLCYVTAIPETQFRFLDGQNAFMKRHGFHIQSICSPGRFLQELEMRDGVSTYPVAISRKISPLLDLVSLFRMVLLFRSIKPDILHVSTPKASLLGALAGRLACVPLIIYYVRGSVTENERGVVRALYRWLEWLTARLSDRTVCVSPSLLQFMRNEGIVDSTEGTVVADGMSNGIDIDLFSPSRVFDDSIYCQQVLQWKNEGCDIVGFVGRLAVDKGINDLEIAWRNLKTLHPQVRLLLVGEWDMVAPVPSDVRKRLEQDEHVFITGVVNDVVPWLKVVDILAFPTHGTEGFPNAIAEAAAMEIPVVGSDAIGVVDAISDGITGAIIPKKDPDSLATFIGEYINNSDKRKCHGINARLRVVEKFQKSRIWNSLLHLYKEFLEEQELSALADSLNHTDDDKENICQRVA
jgi:glycosyltransferase involved in cell wall biosynthesis